MLSAVVCIPAFAQNVNWDVSVIDGGSSIDFGRLRSLNSDGSETGEVSIRQVRITVPENLGRPYTISQILSSRPENQDGGAVSEEAIRFRVQQENGMGSLMTGNEEPLREGPQEIYQSMDGSAASIVITYHLLVPSGQSAGRYYSSLNYRIDVQ